ncbi:MAG: hypothetical protein IJH87_06150, partial [Atopobiaceae bacterium]|nr:hypothetical protein [Atopobiaceae bacterium]
VVKGDARVASISAASIVAKVTRDALMVGMDAVYPGYDLASCKGYASPAHIQAIRDHGLTPIHRVSFCENFVDTGTADGVQSPGGFSSSTRICRACPGRLIFVGSPTVGRLQVHASIPVISSFHHGVQMDWKEEAWSDSPTEAGYPGSGKKRRRFPRQPVVGTRRRNPEGSKASAVHAMRTKRDPHDRRSLQKTRRKETRISRTPLSSGMTSGRRTAG